MIVRCFLMFQYLEHMIIICLTVRGHERWLLVGEFSLLRRVKLS